MYVAVKGGEKAIEAAHKLLDKVRRGDLEIPPITPEQIQSQMSLAVSRVMAEGSLYAPDLAAMAISQAMGDLTEAVFLLRAYRTTLRRLGYSLPLETDEIKPFRRISAAFKDLPGGQILGPTFDYTHRLLDRRPMDKADSTEGDQKTQNFENIKNFEGADNFEEIKNFENPGLINSQALSQPDKSDQSDKSEQSDKPEKFAQSAKPQKSDQPDQLDQPDTPIKPIEAILIEEGLLEEDTPQDGSPGDLTREPPDFPLDRRARLQSLARADEGFLLSMAYSCLRGYGSGHPFVT
ncbi:MAG: carbon-phosphorus lyase complex subunit PhnI, partial [Deltaproteobacteria bacterium]|nr:carbon-phosphorus lyase complex subunit PhnI [Deltaproteobacteria bacterium]